MELLRLLSVQSPTRTLSSCVLHGTKLLIYVCGWQKGGPTNIVAHNVGLVSLSCLTLCNPMDCNLPGFFVHGDSPGKNTGEGCHALLQGIFPAQGSNPGLLHCRWILYQLSHKGSPRILEWVAYPFSNGSSLPRNQTGVSCIAGGFFIN